MKMSALTSLVIHKELIELKQTSGTSIEDYYDAADELQEKAKAINCVVITDDLKCLYQGSSAAVQHDSGCLLRWKKSDDVDTFKESFQAAELRFNQTQEAPNVAALATGSSGGGGGGRGQFGGGRRQDNRDVRDNGNGGGDDGAGGDGGGASGTLTTAATNATNVGTHQT
ncbi:hypothetical protein VaNZ11_013794 [Volvox africanus]|uniref:Uncharacterized protein n=1 Tax=Volvox africanus TaxID=51714 RepID=A0ABQ5SHW3_9CHLO|nr:hypothetical protein VaNZ11_013794 [Volvox africanus]